MTRSTLIWLAMFACSLTTIGLADDTSPQMADVFVSGSEGYHTFRIPALLVSQKGTLLAFCEGRKTGRGDHGDLDLVLKRSSDGGKTWGPLELVYEEGGDRTITIGNPCPVVDQDTGVIWLPFCRDNNDVLVTSSNDDGRTWAKPALITKDVKEANWGWYATGPGNGIQLTRGPHKGRLVIPCDHRVTDRGDLKFSGRSHVIYSDDHGKTWKLGGATDFAMNECAVVELTDGTLMLNMRSYRGKGRRGVATSSDGGLTWTQPIDDPTLIEPVCQASFIRHAWSGSGSASQLLFSNPASTSGRDHLTIRLSEDEGKTWPVSKLLYEGSSAYSCLAALPNGDIGIIYERDNYGRITFARITVSWLMEDKR
jgi:sialidase-1